MEFHREYDCPVCDESTFVVRFTVPDGFIEDAWVETFPSCGHAPPEGADLRAKLEEDGEPYDSIEGMEDEHADYLYHRAKEEGWVR